MPTPRKLIIDYIQQGIISADHVPEALKATQIMPDGERWRTFIDRLLLWLGGLALVFAVLFFVAYNWHDLGRFAKFGMVEGVLVLAVMAYCKCAEGSSAGKMSLLAAVICLGVLLALYGQTYQTGADPWQLFFNWALLILPWAFIGRFAAIWIVWIALTNIAIILYYQTFRGIFGMGYYSETGMLWLAFLVNTLALAMWELLATSRQWQAERWALRLLAIGSGLPLTWLVLLSIFEVFDLRGLPGPVWALWLASMYWVYRKQKLDLFMLAGCCLSAITVIIAFFGKHLSEFGEAGAFLFLALLVIALGSGAALWLKNIHQEGQA